VRTAADCSERSSPWAARSPSPDGPLLDGHRDLSLPVGRTSRTVGVQAIRVDSVAGLASLRAAAQPRAVHYGQQPCWAETDKRAGFKESAKEARQ
jgi:hypothetical protein